MEKFVTATLQVTCTDELAQNYSWQGQKGKIPAENLALSHLIIGKYIKLKNMKDNQTNQFIYLPHSNFELMHFVFFIVYLQLKLEFKKNYYKIIFQ